MAQTAQGGKLLVRNILRLNYEPKKMDASTVHLAKKDWLNQMFNTPRNQDAKTRVNSFAHSATSLFKNKLVLTPITAMLTALKSLLTPDISQVSFSQKGETMLNAVQSTDRNLIEQKSYQQALSDFGIEKLLEKISNYSDENFDSGQMNLEPEEMEILAVLLIQHWSDNVNGKLLGEFLNAIRHGNCALLPNSINQEIKLPESGLPINFPDVKTPDYAEGKKVRWQSAIKNSDWGIVLGHFLAYAPHLCRWSWKYVVLLDKNSPSSDWCVADVAWENDLVEVNNGK